MYRHDDDSSIEYVAAIPVHEKTAKQKRMWRWIAGIVAAVVVIVVVVVVAVVVTDQKKKNKSNNNNNDSGQYVISQYAHMTTIVTNNDTSLTSKERVFVIGDVHGCVNELNALVEKIQYNSTRDQLILAGDLTSKGPDSVGVIRRAKELGALCVRGNHDDKVIRLKTYQLERGEKAMKPPSATMPEGNVPDPLKFKNYHTAVALNMTQDDYNYLSSCPVMLHLPYFNNTVVVHGGLDASVSSLEAQVPYLVMNMRDIYNNQPTPDNDIGVQWSTEWNGAQKNLTTNNTRIFYGHDASRGLNLNDYTFGVDTGCVYGKHLTAINIQTHDLIQTSCLTYVSNDDDDEE